MHPAVTPEMSSGGGGSYGAYFTEDWILRYPKCVGANAVKCSAMVEGTLCNNCCWNNPDINWACNGML